MNNAGAGDKLARGAVKASYLASEQSISQKKWDSIFGDFDPETFKMPDAKKLGQAKETNKSHR
jgi:hypothetical protein